MFKFGVLLFGELFRFGVILLAFKEYGIWERDMARESVDPKDGRIQRTFISGKPTTVRQI